MGIKNNYKSGINIYSLRFFFISLIVVLLEIYITEYNGGIGLDKSASAYIVVLAFAFVLNITFFLIKPNNSNNEYKNLKYQRFLFSTLLMTFIVQSGSFFSTMLLSSKSSMSVIRNIKDKSGLFEQFFIVILVSLVFGIAERIHIFKLIEKKSKIFSVISSIVLYLFAGALLIFGNEDAAMINYVAVGLLAFPLLVFDICLICNYYYHHSDKNYKLVFIFSCIAPVFLVGVIAGKCHEFGIPSFFVLALLMHTVVFGKYRMLLKNINSKKLYIVLFALVTCGLAILLISYIAYCDEYKQCIEYGNTEWEYYCSQRDYRDSDCDFIENEHEISHSIVISEEGKITVTHPVKINILVKLGSKVARFNHIMVDDLIKTSTFKGSANNVHIANLTSDYSLALSIHYLGIIWFVIFLFSFLLFVLYGGSYFSNFSAPVYPFQQKVSELSFCLALVMLVIPLLTNVGIFPIIGVSPFFSGLSNFHILSCTFIMNFMLIKE